MLVNKIISKELPYLVPADRIETALQYMHDWKVSHLPVVNEGQLMGLLEESVLTGLEQRNAKVADFPLLSHAVLPEQHIFEVIGVISANGLTTLPVADETGKYLGEISLSSVIDYMADLQSVRKEGSIIVLEMNDIDYSLGEIARLVEGNDAKVLSAAVTSFDDSRLVEVSLKINQTDIRGVVQTLQRYDYKVRAFYDAPNYEDDLRKRYEELMRYLDI
jgi:predicted transcriptional regulator